MVGRPHKIGIILKKPDSKPPKGGDMDKSILLQNPTGLKGFGEVTSLRSEKIQIR